MKNSFPFVLLVIVILSGCAQPQDLPLTSTATLPAQPTATSIRPLTVSLPSFTPEPLVVSLERGVNLSNALEAPREGEWGLVIHEEYFDLIKQAGFDFVRLPVTWNGHAQEFEPYTIDPLFLFRVDQIVEWALERDLSIIIELHSYPEIMSDPWGQEKRFFAIWRQLAEHYQDHPPNLIFELLNEPHGQIDAAMWNRYVKEALSAIRETNPTRDVVIGSVHWSTHDWISTLDVPDDPHLIVTFHYYNPYDFTHQGAEWVENSTPWLGTIWDGNEAQKNEITQHFESVAEWARRHNVRILLGEFGAYSKADEDSRIRWTEFVRSEADRHGFAWAYWEFGAGFGVYDPNGKVWRHGLLSALVP